MSKRDPKALWRALQDQEAQDDFDEIFGMSDEELDAYIAKNGGDPKAIRASGEALAKELSKQHEERAWQDEMQAKLEAFRKDAATSRPAVLGLSRDELLDRLRAARKDPRFAEPVAMLFQKKSLEASTDEELAMLLHQIELLGKL